MLMKMRALGVRLINREALRDGLHRRLAWAASGYVAVIAMMLAAYSAGHLAYRGGLFIELSAILGGVLLVAGVMHIVRPVDWLLLPLAALMLVLPFVPTLQHEATLLLGVDLLGINSIAVAIPAASLLLARAMWAGLLTVFHGGYGW